MDVGAADAGLVNIDQDIVGTETEDRLVAEPEAGSGLCLTSARMGQEQ